MDLGLPPSSSYFPWSTPELARLIMRAQYDGNVYVHG